MRSKASLIVSPRGQLTLPSGMRNRYGLRKGGVVTIEERDGEIILKPAVVLEVDHYTEADIAQWDREDELAPAEKAKLSKRVGKAR